MFLVGAAIAAAVTFAVVFGDRSSTFESSDDGRRMSHTVRGDASEFSLREDNLKIKADWRGDITLDKTGSNFASVDEYIDIKITEDGATEQLRLEKDGGEIKKSYWREGDLQEDNAESEKQIGALVLRFLRASGFDAEARVARLHDEGGARAVLDEIDNLPSDYAVRRYTEALSDKGILTPDELAALMEKLTRLSSDYDISQAIEAVLEKQSPDAPAVSSALEMAATIGGDYEKRRVLTAAAPKLDAGAVDAALNVLAAIESDHDIRVSAEKLLESEKLGADAVARLLSIAAASVGSDHDLRLILAKAAPHIASEAVADAWLAAYDKLSSNYDSRIALEAAAKYADEAVRPRLRTAANEIDSDYDREQALEALN